MQTKTTPPPTITILCSRFWPERYGGVEERLWNVANFLASHGCDVEVLTENNLDVAPEETLGPRLRIRRFPKFKPGRLWRWYYGAQMLWWLRVLRAHAPKQFVWATDPTMAVAALALGHRKRLVYNPADCVGGMIDICRTHPNITSLDLNHTLSTFDRLAYTWSRWVMVSSDNVRSQFGRFYHQRASIDVCPHGVVVSESGPDRAAARASLGLPAHGFVAGFVGRLDGCKGVDYLIRAIRLSNFGPDDRVLIAGNGPDAARLRTIAREEGVESAIVWAGRVTSPAAAFAAMDVLVLPSVFEAFGLVLLEAMAAGVPCVARAADGHWVLNAAREIIRDGETGLITDTRDPQSLAVSLDWLKDHPEARNAMGERARDYARSQTWDRLIQRYFQAIDGLRPQPSLDHQANEGRMAVVGPAHIP
jgi:glycosyltransferase involved in cell wall biosynthesis